MLLNEHQLKGDTMKEPKLTISQSKRIAQFANSKKFEVARIEQDMTSTWNLTWLFVESKEKSLYLKESYMILLGKRGKITVKSVSCVLADSDKEHRANLAANMLYKTIGSFRKNMLDIMI